MMHAAFGQQPRNDMENTQLQIALMCDEVKELLLSKNAKYGDSALNPTRIFSKASAVEQILVRIDDKLSRIQSGAGLLANDEDVLNDLIGYLFLLKIALNRRESLASPRVIASGSDDVIILGDGMNHYWPNDPWDGIDIDNPYDFINLQAARSPD